MRLSTRGESRGIHYVSKEFWCVYYAYPCRQVWLAHDRLVYVLSIMYTVVVCGGVHKDMKARIEDGFWGQRSFYLPLLTLFYCRCLLHAGPGRARAGLPILDRTLRSSSISCYTWRFRACTDGVLSARHKLCRAVLLMTEFEGIAGACDCTRIS